MSEIDVTLYKDGKGWRVRRAIWTNLIRGHLGFHGDLNETYPVGRVDDDSQRLMRTARKCLDESIKQCKPGALFRDLGKTM